MTPPRSTAWALALAAFTGLAMGAPAPAEAQTAIFFVRHAEKVDESKTAVLSAAGHARAAELARHLRDVGVRAIFTSEFQRTRETAAPLAKALGLEPKVVPAKDADLLVKEVKQRSNDVVLVVSHSDSLPRLLAAFGVTTPIEIGHSEYDNLFLVVPSRSAAPPTFLRLRY